MQNDGQNNGWKWYESNNVAFPGSKGFYQKRLVDTFEKSIHAEIIEYDKIRESGVHWELELNIPGDCWTKVKVYTLTELNFVRIEAIALDIISRFENFNI